MAVLTLTTDFGTSDWYVAAMKGVALSRISDVRLVDVSHAVPPGDVQTASFLLGAAAPTFPDGTVHLAVVDPGVGTERRILAVECRVDDLDGPCRQRFVAPDNGLLDPFLGPNDDQRTVVAVDRDEIFRDAPGHTFHGRDRFAPVAAALLAGTSPADLGRPVDDAVRLGLEPPRRASDSSLGKVLEGTVRHVDRFGNLVTDIPASWLEEADFEATVAGHVTSLRVNTYRQIPAGRAAVLTGSLGTLELSLDGAHLADAWGVARGERVTIRPRSASRHISSTAAEGEQHDPVGVPHHQHSE